MSDLQFDKDLNKILRRLKNLPKEYQKERKKLLRKAAKPVIKAIKAKVKVGNKVHRRYNSKGKLVATYHPGNLKRSIRTLTFRKSKSLFVGPKLGRRGASQGTFKGNKVDGYYGHMVEYGTLHQSPQPFMRPGFKASKGQASRIILVGSAKILRRYAARYRAA